MNPKYKEAEGIRIFVNKGIKKTLSSYGFRQWKK